jgi:hypothetical protein
MSPRRGEHDILHVSHRPVLHKLLENNLDEQ